MGILFYTIVVAAVGYVAPWRQLTGEKFMTAVAFEHAVGSRWIVSIILAAALLSLFKVFNGNLLAASRVVFAMGRRGLIDAPRGAGPSAKSDPAVAVMCVGVATARCMFLGDAILVPITEVGSVASATRLDGCLRRVLSHVPARRAAPGSGRRCRRRLRAWC